MNKITPEKTHDLLEKLADYVMTEIPAIKEKLDQKADKTDIFLVANNVSELKNDVRDVKATQQSMLNNMNFQAKQIDILRLEQLAQSKTLDRVDNRVKALEEKENGFRIKDKEV